MSRCFICDVAGGKEEARIVRDTPDIIAFRSPAPLVPVHLIIAPKRHIPSLVALTEKDAGVLAKILLLAPELARENAIFQCGFRLVANHGPDAGVEEENSHVHFHLLGGTTLTRQLA